MLWGYVGFQHSKCAVKSTRVITDGRILDQTHNCLCYSPANKWGDLEPTMQSLERRKGCKVSTEVTDPAVINTSLIQDNCANAYHGMESVAFQPTTRVRRHTWFHSRNRTLQATWQHCRVHDTVPATGPCNKPDESGTHHPILVLYDPF